MLSNLDANMNFWYPMITEDGYDSSDVVSGSGYTENLLTDDNFFSQVIHRTKGGQLPFLFQPNSSNNNPDGFAIAKIVGGSMDTKQVANGVYSMKLKIREVW